MYFISIYAKNVFENDLRQPHVVHVIPWRCPNARRWCVEVYKTLDLNILLLLFGANTHETTRDILLRDVKLTVTQISGIRTRILLLLFYKYYYYCYNWLSQYKNVQSKCKDDVWILTYRFRFGILDRDTITKQKRFVRLVFFLNFLLLFLFLSPFLNIIIYSFWSIKHFRNA